ncbi:hypothetical protein LTR66_008221 [Elasticomyces elasticus]|nr:hypothetical protein LTR66_008221 [Elasticomyces elasticus]
MAPEVLYRVCFGNVNPPASTHAHLKTYPAILHHFRRQRVAGCDYPAILPHPESTVRGTYVTGLTKADMKRLDIFEGWSYRRKPVKVKILTTTGDASGKGNVEGEEAEAETYVWTDDVRLLDDAEWDFRQFRREKMNFWIGAEGEAEYAEVDSAVKEGTIDPTGGRGLDGSISRELEKHSMREEDTKAEVNENLDD